MTFFDSMTIMKLGETEVVKERFYGAKKIFGMLMLIIQPPQN